MHDGQTISADQTSAVLKQKYRTDKIAWVNGTESHCVNIGTLISLMDILVKHAQTLLTSYAIQGRTQVSRHLCTSLHLCVSGCLCMPVFLYSMSSCVLSMGSMYCIFPVDISVFHLDISAFCMDISVFHMNIAVFHMASCCISVSFICENLIYIYISNSQQ